MHEDPCRRFVIGATLEVTSMRLWFCNRTMIIASEEFDINYVRTIIPLYSHMLIMCIIGCENTNQINTMPRILRQDRNGLGLNYELGIQG